MPHNCFSMLGKYATQWYDSSYDEITKSSFRMDVVFDKLETSEQLVPVNWQGIRVEYFKVWADFALIAKPFGIILSEQQINALGHMLASMDLIDSAIDRESQIQTRQQLCESILSWMNKEESYFLAEKLDTRRLTELRNIIAYRQITTPFLVAAARVFVASERKRNAPTVSELVKNLIDEGQAAAEMTIQILDRNTNTRFNNFLQRIMRIGTIVDTLLDAHDDFENSILNLVPNRRFRWKLKLAIARQLPGLIFSFPNRGLLWRYCLSYTSTELKHRYKNTTGT